MKKLFKYSGPVFLYQAIYKRECVYYVHAMNAAQAMVALNTTKRSKSGKRGQIAEEFKRSDIKGKKKYIKEEK